MTAKMAKDWWTSTKREINMIRSCHHREPEQSLRYPFRPKTCKGKIAKYFFVALWVIMWRCPSMGPPQQQQESDLKLAKSRQHVPLHRSKVLLLGTRRFFSRNLSSGAMFEHNADPAGVAKRPSCKSCSRTCRRSKRSTWNLPCASRSTLSSESSAARRPLFFYEHPRAALSSRSRYGTALETSQSIP